MEYHYYKRVIGYRTRVEKMDNEKLAYRVYNYIMESPQKFGYKQSLKSLERLLSGKPLEEWYVQSINNMKNLHVSSCYMLPPKIAPGDEPSLRLFSFDEVSKTYAEFVTMNAGLGNRGPVKSFKQHKWCQLCVRRNIKEKLNEHHILFQCHFLRRLHERYGLAKYKQDHSQLEISQIYKKFWTDDLSSDVILGRVESADAIRQAYIGAMKTLLRP